MPAHLVVLFTSLFLGLQPITSDTYLPALPMLTQALSAGMPQAQLTLSAMLICFGTSQLVWGPMSDRFGRRPILLIGLSLYTVAALACAFVQNMESLIALRALEGVALGACIMSGRAMIRDLFAPAEAARAMSRGLSGLGVIALLAVPAGSIAAHWGGWRLTVALPGVYSAVVLVLTWMHFAETNGRKNPEALQAGTLIQTWRRILAHPQFWAYAMLALCSYCTLFVFLATSSFVYIQVLGHGILFYCMVMMLISAVYILGTFIARRLMAKLGVQRTVYRGAAIAVLAGLMYLGFYAAGWRDASALLLPQLVYMFAHGFHQPAGQSGAAAAFPEAAGAATAMTGFLMMLAAFAVAGWLGHAMDGTVWPMVAGVAFWCFMLAMVSFVLVRRYGQLGGH